jgi:hypothetical protein
MRFLRRLVIIVVIWQAAAPIGRAASQASSATLSASLNPVANITLSTASVSFPDADPDTVPQIPSNGGPILITAKARATGGAQVLLTVQATDDLRSGVTVIPASNITWTATGTGFLNGTLSATAPVTLAAWNNSGIRTGSQQLYFRNLWTHPTGTYTLSIVYTLTAP